MLIITLLLVAASMLNEACNQNTEGNRFPSSLTTAIKNTFARDWTGMGHAFYVNNGVFARVVLRTLQQRIMFDPKDNLLSIKVTDSLIILQFGTEEELGYLNFGSIPGGNLRIKSLNAHIIVRRFHHGNIYRITLDKLQVSDFQVNHRGMRDIAKILRDDTRNPQYITVVEKLMTKVLYRLVSSSLP